MSTFNAKTATKLAVPDPRTDHKLPNSRSLWFKNITKHTAVQGTVGQRCDLTHGDSWRETRGNHLENITRDQKHTVGQNQTIQIGGNHKETVVGSCVQNMMGPQLVTNLTVRNETRLDTYTEVYGDAEWVYDADGSREVKPGEISIVFVTSWSVILTQVEMALGHLEIGGPHIELKVAHGEHDLIKEEEAPVAINTTALENRIDALRSNLFMALFEMGEMATDPTSVGMINILLGVNQAI